MSKNVNLLEGNIAISLTKLSVPLMGMSFLQMAYNLTDMFWIGKLGAGAVASIGTGGLLVWLSMGIHTIAQLGGQVYVGQSLGAGDVKRAAKFAHSAMCISIVCSIILGLTCTIAIDPIVSIFALNGEDVIRDAKLYIFVCCGFIFVQLMTKLLTTLITTTGNSKTPFVATTIGLVFNIILDPIFIFGFGIIPPLGVLGAAIATVLSQMIVLVIIIIYIRMDTYLFCHIKLFSLPDLSAVKRIIKLGIPTTIQASLFPLFSIVISRMVASFGDDAIAVQRVGSQIESLSWMVTDGFAIAVNSFIAQNYGAKNITRTKKGFYQSFGILSIYGVLVTIFLLLFASQLFSIFLNDDKVVKMGTDYLAILGFSQLFLCWEILSNTSINALGKTFAPALVVTVCTVMRIPLAMVLIATILELNGIWWAVTISTILKGLILPVVVLYYFRKISNENKIYK